MRLSIKYLARNGSVIRSQQHSSLPDRTLVVKLFYKNGESITVTLLKFCWEKVLKAQKRSFSFNEILNLVRSFEKTGSLEDRPWSGRPALRVNRVHVVQFVIKDLAAKTLTDSSNVREAERRMGIPDLSIQRILHLMLDLHPYEIQALHQLLPEDTSSKQKFATWALEQMECYPQWLLNVMWTDEANFSLYGEVNIQNSRIWETSNSREYHSQPLHSPRVTVSVVLLGLLFWSLSFLKNLVLNLAEKPVLSLQNGILRL